MILYVLPLLACNGGKGSSAPQAADASETVSEDGPALAARVPTATDPDGDLDPQGYALVDDVAQGTLTFSTDGSYTYDPGTDFHALPAGESEVVSFTWTASDLAGATSSPATVEITVEGRNDAPTATDTLPDLSAVVLSPLSESLDAATFDDVDQPDTLSWRLTGQPDWLAFDPATRTLSGTPDGADVGTVQLAAVATDQAGATAEVSFALTVTETQHSEQYLYDAAGRLIEAVYADGTRVVYTYDAAGNVLGQEVLPP